MLIQSKQTTERINSHFKEYLRSLILTMNELLDFDMHRVIVYDDKSDSFPLQWHFLLGESPRNGCQIIPSHQRMLREIMESGKTHWKTTKRYHDRTDLCDALILPLKCAKQAKGLLALWPISATGQSTLSKYDLFLADSLLRIIEPHYWSSDGHDYWASLSFGLLHRRQFLAGAIGFEQVIGEFLSRLIDDNIFQPFPKGCPLWVEVRFVKRQYALRDSAFEVGRDKRKEQRSQSWV